MVRARSVGVAVAIFALCITAAAATRAVAAEQAFVTIGTGGVTGVYYPTGGAICRLVNMGRKEHGVRCSVEPTSGSVYNIETLRAGELDLAVAQSDTLFHAYRGSGEFEEQGAYQDLRAIFSVHPEPFTVVARADAGIESFEDLKGKRVNIGNPGSGQRATMEVVMDAFGWTTEDFALATELPPTEQSQALCDGKIDAIVYTVGHPSASIKEATTSCDGVIVPVEGPEIVELIAEKPFYRKAVIPGEMYRGNEQDVPTFGVGATVVTSTTLKPEIVSVVVRSVFENFDEFRDLHPAFANLTKREMVKDGIPAPLHEGAARYYEEAGLLGPKASAAAPGASEASTPGSSDTR